MKEALEMLNSNTRKSTVTGVVLDHLPFLRFIIPGFTGFSELKERQERMWHFFMVNIKISKSKEEYYLI